MLGVLSRMLRRFGYEEKGVVIIIFLLVVVPLLLIIAIGIDFSQTLIVKRQLTSAIDSAALALGRLPDVTEQEDIEAKAEAYIRAHYPEAGIGNLTGFTANRIDTGNGGSQIVITATAVVPTTLMQIGGVDNLTVSVSSTVLRQENFLEVVMVLDNSGSMGGGGKLTAMKNAAKDLVNILFAGQAVSDKVKIGLVPFEGGVNVGVPSDTPWLDKDSPAPFNYDPALSYFDDLSSGATPAESIFSVIDSMNGGIASNWRGCVRSRISPHDIEDTPADASIPETLFSAYLNPYLGSSKSNYVNQAPSTQANSNCAVAPIQPLTNDKATIDAAIDAMTASTTTNITEGVAWGWRVVSPNVPFTEGAPYDQQQVIKAIIALTDGETFVNGFSSFGIGNASNPQIGPDVNAGANSKLEQLCTNIKADKDGVAGDTDVVVYTITFGGLSAPTEQRMRDCATDPSKYFNSPTNAELLAAFQSIASSLNQLRVLF